MKIVDRQAHASHCELVDQLFSAEAFPSITENRKGLELSPEGLRMPIWGFKYSLLGSPFHINIMKELSGAC